MSWDHFWTILQINTGLNDTLYVVILLDWLDYFYYLQAIQSETLRPILVDSFVRESMDGTSLSFINFPHRPWMD